MPSSTPKPVPPCLVCLWSSKFDASEYAFSVHAFCSHQKYHHSPTSQYKISKPFLVFFVIGMVFLVVASTSYFFEIPKSCQNLNSSCMTFISDLLFTTCSTMQGLFVLRSTKTYVSELNSWLFIFENPHLYGCVQILDSPAYARFKVAKILSPVIFSFSCILTVVGFSRSYHDSSWVLVRKSAVYVLYGYHGLSTVRLVKRFSLIGASLRALERSLSRLLQKRSRKMLINRLKRWQNCVSRIHSNISMFMETAVFLLVLWFIVATTSLVFNIFILIKYEDYDVQDVVYLQVRNLVSVVGIFVILVMCEEDVNKKVSRK